MAIKTYYWADRTNKPLKYLFNRYVRKNSFFFRRGNAGDIYAKYLINFLYDQPIVNQRNGDHRLLLIGSISHLVRDDDLVCGIGSKRSDFMTSNLKSVKIWALRGPKTHDLFKRAGFDVSSIKFLFDPGLMIRFTINPTYFEQSKEKVSFIPHYRERFLYQGNLPDEINLIDIDACPHKVGKQILNSKVVFSSSLHGVIFSHSLGVPCILVKPQTEEPLSKFEDYYLSVDLSMPVPLDSIYDFKKHFGDHSPAEIKLSRDCFEFPSFNYLEQNGYVI